MDKPAERVTREKQFRVRVPIGANFITTNILNYIILYILNSNAIYHEKLYLDRLKCNKTLGAVYLMNY